MEAYYENLLFEIAEYPWCYKKFKPNNNSHTQIHNLHTTNEIILLHYTLSFPKIWTEPNEHAKNMTLCLEYVLIFRAKGRDHRSWEINGNFSTLKFLCRDWSTFKFYDAIKNNNSNFVCCMNARVYNGCCVEVFQKFSELMKSVILIFIIGGVWLMIVLFIRNVQ